MSGQQSDPSPVVIESRRLLRQVLELGMEKGSQSVPAMLRDQITLSLMMADTLLRIESALGEPRTGSATTPTCGSTEPGSEKMSDGEAREASERNHIYG